MQSALRRRTLFLGVSFLMLLGVIGCGKKNVSTNPTAVEFTTVLYGQIKGGKGSGFVGGPLSGVEITATYDGKRVGPESTDAAGTFALDLMDLLPGGIQNTQDSLQQLNPVPVDVTFEREGFKTQTEVITLPIMKHEEYVFYLSSEG